MHSQFVFFKLNNKISVEIIVIILVVTGHLVILIGITSLIHIVKYVDKQQFFFPIVPCHKSIAGNSSFVPLTPSR